jgi:hypothetical protein
MKKHIKKADLEVVRLLVELALTSPYHLNRSVGVVRSVKYLVDKYGTTAVGKAFDLIRSERGENHEVHGR